MCGIVGGISERNVVPIILEGLARLEYRGYDSVGIAVIDSKGELVRERTTGRVKELYSQTEKAKLRGTIGIGHTRWATHGLVTTKNAHPHISGNRLAIVHNGIIENYALIKDGLLKRGYQFESETDTEVVLHLVHSIYSANGGDLLDAVKQATCQIHGAYAIAIINKDFPDQVVCARFGSPLVFGVGINEMFFASDISALLPVTQKVVYLEDGDIGLLQLSGYKVWNKSNQLVDRKVRVSQLSANSADLGHYRHYMQKEIFEQPRAVADTLSHLGNSFSPHIFGSDASGVLQKIDKVQIIACGTSYNAGLIAKYWLAQYADLECDVEIASEYRTRLVPSRPNTLVVSISQSGETADTMASIKYAIELGMDKTLSICNVAESSLVRISKLHVLTQAGPEIGVASTKAFTTQLVVLLYLTFTLAKMRGRLDAEQESNVLSQIRRLPQLIIDTLLVEDEIKQVAKDLEYKQNALFLGRHVMWSIASEGALKLKEISYIHAESYAAGELKHGPLALIDKDMPVIVVMPSQIVMEKVKSNIQEILARNGQVYLLTDSVGEVSKLCHKTIILPYKDVPEYLLPIIYAIPMQLLSYHTALCKGTDVDKPRNLAKSVTVE